MYTRFQSSTNDFVDKLLNGSALPTGSESPFRINNDVLTALKAAGEAGVEAELVEVSPTVQGGQWVDDNNATRQGYIGNFSCQVKIGSHQTFANLDVATVLQFQMNGGKLVVKASQPVKDGQPLTTKGGQPVWNIVSTKSFVVDVQNPQQKTALLSVKVLANKGSEVATPATAPTI